MTEQPNVNGIDWDDLPPHIQKAVVDQATNIDLHRMAHEEIAHQFPKLMNFILEHDPTGEQLTFLRNTLDQGFQSDGSADLHKSGIVTGVLTTLGYCATCGGKHEDIETEVQKLSHAEGPAIIKSVDPNKSPQTWADFIVSLSEEKTADLAAYNVSFIVQEYPKVKCNKCGAVYVSLEDRMVKRDCHFCQIMDATGELP